MRSQDIEIGVSYRHRNNPNYSYAKVLEVVPPKTGVNTHGYSICKCEWSVGKNDNFGMIKHFRPVDLIKDKI